MVGDVSVCVVVRYADRLAQLDDHEAKLREQLSFEDSRDFETPLK
jgi:hypothetical protein